MPRETELPRLLVRIMAAMYQSLSGGVRQRFDDLATLMACASPLRSGDVLAGHSGVALKDDGEHERQGMA